VKRVALVFVAALLAAPLAHASERHPTQAELEGEVMCPVCGTTLDQSSSPAAQQIKRVIAKDIAAGKTKRLRPAGLVAADRRHRHRRRGRRSRRVAMVACA